MSRVPWCSSKLERVSDPRRQRARRLAAEGLARGDALSWFDRLYQEAEAGNAIVLWADLHPNPHLVSWLRQPSSWSRALVVGCGLGDDAECLAASGIDQVVACDTSHVAIAQARRRFAESSVTYTVADALTPPTGWHNAFDLVVEVYTLQVLPPELRRPLVAGLAQCVAPGGTLLVISRARDDHEPAGELPWPLTRAEVELPTAFGLECRQLEDLMDDETPPVRRFVGAFVRPIDVALRRKEIG